MKENGMMQNQNKDKYTWENCTNNKIFKIALCLKVA